MLLTVLLLVDSPTQPININLYFCLTAEVKTLECIMYPKKYSYYN